MKSNNIFITIAAILFFAGIGFFAGRWVYQADKQSVVSDTTIRKVVEPPDPELLTIETEIPEPIIDTLRDTVKIIKETVKDTAVLVDEYFQSRLYSDTIKKDSSFKAVYRAWVQANRLQDFQFEHQNLREKEINQTIIKNYRDGFYLGGLMAAMPGAVDIGPSLEYIEGKNSFSFSAGLVNQTYLFSYKRRINLPSVPF